MGADPLQTHVIHRQLTDTAGSPRKYITTDKTQSNTTDCRYIHTYLQMLDVESCDVMKKRIELQC
jgi:hypothetical protein